MPEKLQALDAIAINLGRGNRNMLISFPPGMSRNERKKAVSELFKMIRTIQDTR